MTDDKVEIDPYVRASNSEVFAAGIGAIATAVLLGHQQNDWLFHQDEVRAATSKIDHLKKQVNSYQETKVLFEDAHVRLPAELKHLLDETTAKKNSEIHAIAEHAPKNQGGQFAESVALGVSESLLAGLLVGVGVYKIRKTWARHQPKQSIAVHPHPEA